jgi:hypothetical protein
VSAHAVMDAFSGEDKMSARDGWLVPFKGRGISGCCDQNFVWKGGNIYIMDNHRAASWCWCQHIQKDQAYSLLHIDAHYDTALVHSQKEPWFKNLPDLWEADLDTVLSYSRPNALAGGETPCVGWDNYLSLFMKKYPGVVDLEESVFATQKQGDPPNCAVPPHPGGAGTDHSTESEVSCPPTIENGQNLWEAYPHEFLDIPSLIASPRRSQWICNVDLDYFFFECEADGQGGVREMFSSSYIECVFASLRKAIDSGRILVFTMALSPECCGGWEPAEKLASDVCGVMRIPFSLPPK